MSGVTSLDVINTLCDWIEKSELKSGVSGGLYKGNTRPVDSTLEDIVVNAITGDFEQVQECSVNINIFVPRIEGFGNNVFVSDTKRISEIARLLNNFVEFIMYSESQTEYDIKPANIVHYGESLSIKQDYVNITLRMYRLK